MRKLQKLVRNGNSTQITIPHQMLTHLGWLAGEYVIVEVTEQGTLALRYPDERDMVKPSARRPAPAALAEVRS